MNFTYVIPRVLRHFMPEGTADWMKRRGFIIKAGIETSAPAAAAERYIAHLSKAGIPIEDKCLMIFGYGGNVTTACELLNRGAKKVMLVERDGMPLPNLQVSLLENYPKYFLSDGTAYKPNPTYLHIIHQDIRRLAKNKQVEKVDLVLSSSVFEHLDDVEEILRALHALTKSDGAHLHFVDLRDHFFKYPFEMLTFSERCWKKWLNPTSNLNRLRIADYRSLFEKYFSFVDIQILESDLRAFLKVKDKINSRFLSGIDSQDCATIISIVAKV